MNLFGAFAAGLEQMVSLPAIAGLFAGTVLGFIFGVIPGLQSVTALVVVLPFTFGLDPLVAMYIFAGIIGFRRPRRLDHGNRARHSRHGAERGHRARRLSHVEARRNQPRPGHRRVHCHAGRDIWSCHIAAVHPGLRSVPHELRSGGTLLDHGVRARGDVGGAPDQFPGGTRSGQHRHHSRRCRIWRPDHRRAALYVRQHLSDRRSRSGGRDHRPARSQRSDRLPVPEPAARRHRSAAGLVACHAGMEAVPARDARAAALPHHRHPFLRDRDADRCRAGGRRCGRPVLLLQHGLCRIEGAEPLRKRLRRGADRGRSCRGRKGGRDPAADGRSSGFRETAKWRWSWRRG